MGILFSLSHQPDLDSLLCCSSDSCLMGRVDPLKQVLPADIKVDGEVKIQMEVCAALCAECPRYSIWEHCSAEKLVLTILKLPLPSVACPDILRIPDRVSPQMPGTVVRCGNLLSGQMMFQFMLYIRIQNVASCKF